MSTDNADNATGDMTNPNSSTDSPAGAAPAAASLEVPGPGLVEAVSLYARIGLMSFGGPAGQIALMQTEIVERRRWVDGNAFDRGLSFSMMLPGPEAQQLATWLGWRLHGIAGGLAAGLLFILPGAVLMLGLAWLAAAGGDLPLIAAIFAGVQPVVIAVVLQAMKKLAGRALGGPIAYGLAVAAFAGLAIAGLPFPLIVALAAVAGLVLPLTGEGKADSEGAANPDASVLGRGLTVTGVTIALVAMVFIAARALSGTDPMDDIATLFTTAAFVSFGGAYALLPYVADQAVDSYGWLSAAEMLNGLAIAEATPGPLILVTTYAGFFAGWSAEGGGAALGIATGSLATFYTFAPSFMLILAFAPVVERLHGLAPVRKALAGISAAVVGVIANLAVYLGAAAFFPTGIASAEWAKLVLFAIAMWAVFARGIGVLTLVGAGALAGVVLHLIGLL
ncbi:MAG: chromate efflux transporter [Pseudomonadota bacterium]